MNLQEQITAATLDVFNTMVMMEATPCEPLPEKVNTFQNTVSGMLGFSGELRGMVSVHCPDKLAIAITASMLMMELDEIPEVDSDVKDTIGELANMIAGGLKISLAEEGKDIDITIPTVLGGKAYTVSSMARAEWFIIPFSIGEDKLLIEFQYKTFPGILKK